MGVGPRGAGLHRGIRRGGSRANRHDDNVGAGFAAGRCRAAKQSDREGAANVNVGAPSCRLRGRAVSASNAERSARGCQNVAHTRALLACGGRARSTSAPKKHFRLCTRGERDPRIPYACAMTTTEVRANNGRQHWQLCLAINSDGHLCRASGRSEPVAATELTARVGRRSGPPIDNHAPT